MVTSLPRIVLTRVSTGERLGLRKDATAGRVEGSEILLSEGGTSRTHAQITFVGEAVWVEDSGSANGTFINDAQITQRAALASGDRLRFGGEAFEVWLAPPVAVAPAPAPIPAPPAASVAGFPDEDTDKKKRPGAWANSLTLQPPAPTGKATKYLAPSEIKQMMGNGDRPTVAAADLGVPHLQIITGTRAGANLPLGGGPLRMTEWSIGSDPQRDVLLPDEGVSALHARITNEGQRWKVVDQMSANGTFVNGKRSSVSFISAGDRLLFGRVECLFQTQGWVSGQRPDENSQQAPGAKGRRKTLELAAFVALALAALAYGILRTRGP